jgi:hypothetical protein
MGKEGKRRGRRGEGGRKEGRRGKKMWAIPESTVIHQTH